MYFSYYGVSTFKVLPNGAVRLLRDFYIDEDKVEELVEKLQPDDNIWDADIKFSVFANKEGIGFAHEIPGGYSEYTYDPERTTKFYIGATLDWFIMFGLDTDEREFLTVNDLHTIRVALARIQGAQSGT